MIYLIFEFMKAGLFAIGGGLATIPFLQSMAMRYDRFNEEDIMDMLAVSESTPGAMGINMATFAGNNAYGIRGGIIATLALITPSVIVIIIIANALEKFKNSKIVADAFYMLRPSTAGLVFGAMAPVMIKSLLNIGLYEKTKTLTDLISLEHLIFFAISFALIYKYKKIHPIFVIILGAILGIAFNMGL